jgi:hypothetical protein
MAPEGDRCGLLELKGNPRSEKRRNASLHREDLCVGNRLLRNDVERERIGSVLDPLVLRDPGDVPKVGIDLVGMHDAAVGKGEVLDRPSVHRG